MDWLINKTPRSVDQLRLWPQNPRLNPEEKHIKLTDFAEDFTHEDSDKKEFIRLIKSIVEDGFIPADPIVVWQNEGNKKYYIAEGNRRVVALKLLRHPEKSPLRIRSIVRGYSSRVNLNDIEKIYVNVAPTFDEAIWYINQRNSSSSLRRNWTREQQQRWIAELYDQYSGDVEKIISKTKMSKNELESIIRLLKIKDFVKVGDVKSKLTQEEFALANSYRFPMTVLERFFNLDVRQAWGLEYNGIDVKIISNKQSFYNAFSELIKNIITKQINTRFTKVDLPDILDRLPPVSFENIEEVIDDSALIQKNNAINDTDTIDDSTSTPINKNVRGNQCRKRLIPDICRLRISNHKLSELFKELKKMPFTYKHSMSVTLRVFIDLSVFEYINAEGIEDNISTNYKCDFKDITLSGKLKYLKNNHLNKTAKNIIGRLIDPEQNYSLDVLNGYIHSKDTHYSSQQFLNGFWDFLYPLFESLLDIKEE